MIQVNIKNIESQQITHGGQFPSMEEAQAWIDSIQSMSPCPWGQQAYPVQVEVSPAVEAVYEEQEVLMSAAVLDEQGVELEPAQYEMQQVLVSEAVPAVWEEQMMPASYAVEITDISAQLEQERVNAEALEYLSSTDWMVVRAMERGEELSAEFKAERQAARDRIVK